MKTRTTYRIPRLVSHLQAKSHPEMAKLETESHEWVRKNLSHMLRTPGDIELLIEQRIAQWTCLVYPDASPDTASALCNLFQYFFALDDICISQTGGHQDSAAAMMRDILELLERPGSRPESAESLEMLADALRPIAANQTPEQQRRFLRHMKSFLCGFATESEIRAGKTILEMDDLLALRRETCGGKWCFELIEYGLGISLPDHILDREEIRRLQCAALDQLLLVNDLFSYRKEFAVGDHINAVPVLRNSEGLEMQGAVDAVCGLIGERGRDFSQARHDIMSGDLAGLHDLTRYVESLGHMMAGNLLWHYTSTRYHGSGYTWNGEFDLTVELEVGDE